MECNQLAINDSVFLHRWISPGAINRPLLILKNSKLFGDGYVAVRNGPCDTAKFSDNGPIETTSFLKIVKSVCIMDLNTEFSSNSAESSSTRLKSSYSRNQFRQGSRGVCCHLDQFLIIALIRARTTTVPVVLSTPGLYP